MGILHLVELEEERDDLTKVSDRGRYGHDMYIFAISQIT